jgi:hypothetical protein
MAVPFRYSGTTGTTSLIARWVDSSNHLRFDLATVSAGVWFLRLVKVIAGVETVLASSASTSQITTALRLVVYASGRAIGTDTTSGVSIEASDSTLATSGTLATGKPGVGDQGGGTGSNQHYLDDISVSTPAAEQVAVYSGRNMQIRYDDTIRQDSTGTYYGRPQSYRGGRFLLPVGTSRVLVKARRNDIEVATDSNVTDATQIQVGWTPRGLAVPR